MRADLPFSAVVGQEDLKLALVLAAVDPGIGGVLITGERGTAKSTAARGLAALLPESGDGVPAPFVELPIGATEDRVVGSMDIAKVLRDGSPQLRSGLLARAHGGVLYVDEVNLLPDHIVDLLLDAAASGRVTVERDGISAGEAARFILVGTMNPEEGELRPQFVDRFGLCVPVRGLREPEARISAIRRRLAFDEDPLGVSLGFQAAERAIRGGIAAARTRLATLDIADAHLALVAQLSIDHHLDGIRGDLAIIKAARALAAWEGVGHITERHIRRAADLALPHRLRKGRPASSARAEARPKPPDPTPPAADREPAGTPGASPPVESPQQAAPAADRGSARLLTDLIDRHSRGRRGTESAAAEQVIGVVPFEHTGTLAIHDTLAAAAQRGVRVAEQGIALAASDLKQHLRQGPGRSHVLFLVDASGSMAVQRRLEIAKGAALGLLASSYQRRDEVALMVFRAQGADLVLPFTRHVAAIERALAEVPTGGRTPLAQALLEAAGLLRTRQPALLVLLTDGRANVSANGGEPWAEALAACPVLRASCAGGLVIDCEAGPVTLGRARTLAQTLGVECIGLDSLDAEALTLRIHRRLEGL